MIYKCLNKLAPDYFNSCISKLSDRHTRELWNSATDLLIPRMRTSFDQQSFVFRGVRVFYKKTAILPEPLSSKLSQS